MMLLPIITTILSIIAIFVYDPGYGWASAILIPMSIFGMANSYQSVLVIERNRELVKEVERLKTFERHVSKS